MLKGSVTVHKWNENSSMEFFFRRDKPGWETTPLIPPPTVLRRDLRVTSESVKRLELGQVSAARQKFSVLLYFFPNTLMLGKVQSQKIEVP